MNPVCPRRQYTANSVPQVTGQYAIEESELVINWADGILYTRSPDNTLVTLPVGGSGGSSSIVEATTAAGFPATGSAGTLYHATDARRIYFWNASGGVYVEAGTSGGGSGSGLTWSSVPTSATATGTAGQIAYDNTNGFFYVATATNTWKRASLSSWNVDSYLSSVSLLLSMEGTGSSFVDSSLSPKTITAYYGATQSSTQYKFGSQSLYLNGSTYGSAPFLSVPYSSAFDLSTGDWTVECWAYATVLNQANNLFAITSTASAYAQARVIPQEDGSALFLTQDSGGNWIYTTSSAAGTFATNTWQHVAAVRAGNLFRLYVNGTSVISFTSASALNSGSGLTTIGAAIQNGSTTTGNSTVGSQTWQGYIDDFRVTKVARYSGSSITVPATAFPTS
jgi:hypothetical protein